METVAEGKTGVFFNEPTEESLMDAIQRLDRMPIDPHAIRAHAEQFDVESFKARLSQYVEHYRAEHNRHLERLSPENLGYIPVYREDK